MQNEGAQKERRIREPVEDRLKLGSPSLPASKLVREHSGPVPLSRDKRQFFEYVKQTQVVVFSC